MIMSDMKKIHSRTFCTSRQEGRTPGLDMLKSASQEYLICLPNYLSQHPQSCFSSAPLSFAVGDWSGSAINALLKPSDCVDVGSLIVAFAAGALAVACLWIRTKLTSPTPTDKDTPNKGNADDLITLYGEAPPRQPRVLAFARV